MHTIEHIYIDGAFVAPHGREVFALIDPSTERPFGSVILADAEDARLAVAAARRALPAMRASSRAQRAAWLLALRDAVLARADALADALTLEYGATRAAAVARVRLAAQMFEDARATLLDFPFVRAIGAARVTLEPVGVAAIITPWNGNYSFIANKLGTAIAAGCTAVVKPSELSAWQTRLFTECLHAAKLPAGVINIVTGRGEPVGAALTAHPDVAKISFTGSTAVGKAIARGAVDTMKRVTLELGGKSPNILLDDADLDAAIPLALAACFFNNGQACVAASRLLVPRERLDDVKRRVLAAMDAVHAGDPRDERTTVGPLVSRTQFERVQRYIRLGLEEGAELLAGGPGLPDGITQGYFTRPTVFIGVTPAMTIAREEIFGPVLCILTYETEDEAVAIANDTPYGLQAYVSGGLARANAVAARIEAGRVHINGLHSDMRAPFGGFKQSGIGREFGSYGMEAYLEPKAVLGGGGEAGGGLMR
jgi:aldehyde dehydrogenase (NAD+)